MATQNVRVVGYLPPPYHEKLREYMLEQSLTESAAIVKIIKHFFDSPQVPKVTPEKDNEIASLKADIAQLMQRVTILEQAVASPRRFSKPRTSYPPKPQPVLPPLPCTELARRLGVSASTLEEACQKGEAYFRDWSQRRDPAKRAWQKRGELFHPLSD